MTYPYKPTGMLISVKLRVPAMEWMAIQGTLAWRRVMQANDALLRISKLKVGQEDRAALDASTLRCLEAALKHSPKGNKLFSVVWLNDVAVITRTV